MHYVYIQYCNGKPYYIGMTKNPNTRATQYYDNNTDSRKEFLKDYVGCPLTVEVIECGTKNKARALEAKLIREYSAKYGLCNKVHNKIVKPTKPKQQKVVYDTYSGVETPSKLSRSDLDYLY